MIRALTLLMSLITAAAVAGFFATNGAMAASLSAKQKRARAKILDKTPKSLFLIKKIKVSPDVGEPQFSPEQAQLRTVINDPVLHNYKKFE